MRTQRPADGFYAAFVAMGGGTCAARKAHEGVFSQYWATTQPSTS